MEEMIGPKNRKYLLCVGNKIKAHLSFDIMAKDTDTEKLLNNFNPIPNVICDYKMELLSFVFIKDSGL